MRRSIALAFMLAIVATMTAFGSALAWQVKVYECTEPGTSGGVHVPQESWAQGYTLFIHQDGELVATGDPGDRVDLPSGSYVGKWSNDGGETFSPDKQYFTIYNDCPKPPSPPKKVYKTLAAIPGPCGDPYVRFVVKNKGNTTDRVVMGYTGRSGVVKKIVKTIPAGMIFRTGWRYALPDTRVWVKSQTQNKVLVQTSFEGGNYGRCYSVNTGFTPIR